MDDNFSNSQTTRKVVIATKAGVVAAQHRRAAEVGAAVLDAGGDAVDDSAKKSSKRPGVLGLTAVGRIQENRRRACGDPADSSRASSASYSCCKSRPIWSSVASLSTWPSPSVTTPSICEASETAASRRRT